MFFIFGFGNRKGGEAQAVDSVNRTYNLFYIGNCFSLFFIPVFTFAKIYYITLGNQSREISKEQYLEIKSSGRVPSELEGLMGSDYGTSYKETAEQAKYTGGICPVCKKELTDEFAYCPYCGQKRPRA